MCNVACFEGEIFVTGTLLKLGMAKSVLKAHTNFCKNSHLGSD